MVGTVVTDLTKRLAYSCTAFCVAAGLLFIASSHVRGQLNCQTKFSQDIGREIRLSPNSCVEMPFIGLGKVHLLEATQIGVDLRLQVMDEGGKDVVYPVDSPNRNFGTEVIAFLGEQNANYKIRVSWVEPDLTYSSDGSFTVNELRTSPGQENPAFVNSLQLASNSLAVGSQSPTGENLEKLLTAAKLFETLISASQKSEWLRYRLALTYHMIGRSHREVGKNREAVNWFQRINSLVPGSHIDGESLSDLGLALHRLGRFDESRVALEKSIPTIKKHGNIDDLALAHTRLAVTLNKLGRTRDAIAQNSAAERLGVTRTATRLTLLNNRALFLATIGRRGEALEILRPLPEEFFRINQPREAVYSLSIIIGIFETLEAFDEARSYLQKLRLAASSLPAPVIARSINSYFLGRIQQDPSKAIANFEDALIDYRQLNDQYAQANIFNQIGMQYYSLGAKRRGFDVKALENFRKASSMFSELGSQNDLGNVLNNIGALFVRSGRVDEGLTHFLQARAIFHTSEGVAGEADTLSNLMDTWAKKGSRRIAITYGRESVNRYQRLRANIEQLDQTTKDAYFRSVSDTYRRLAGLLIAEGLISEAERVMELLKAREVLDFQGGTGQAEFLSISEMETEDREAMEKVDASGTEVFSISSEIEKLESVPNPDAETQAKLATLRRQLRAAKDEFRKFLADLSKRIGSRTLAVNQLDSRLQIRLKRLVDQKVSGLPIISVTTIVEKDRLSLILTTPSAQRARTVRLADAELNGAVSALRSDLKDRNSKSYRQNAQRLYDLVVKPIEEDLARSRARTILWSLDGPLRYLPVAALYDEKRGYLVQRFANVVVSLGEADVITSDRRAEWVSTGFGVSKAFENFADLNQVPDELDCIIEQPGKRFSLDKPVCASGLVNGTKYLDEEFTSSRLIEAAPRSNHLHLATHFELGKTIAESYMLVGGGESRKFSIRELEDNGSFQNSDLVYLSACNTGTPSAGDDGREVESFASIVQKLGSQSVISTQWLVSHRSTTRFNRTFYSNYIEKKMNKAEAIRQAQLSHAGLPDLAPDAPGTLPTQTDYSHPYFWAPFVLYGNWK